MKPIISGVVNAGKLIADIIEKNSSGDKKDNGSISKPSDTGQTGVDSGRSPAENGNDSLTVMAEKLLEDIMASRDSFSYDMNAGSLYKQYADMYKKQADFAARDIFGLAAALTGGYSNSYAMTAASQAGEKAYSGLYDAIEKAQDKAYDRYLSSEKQDYELLDAIKQVNSLKNGEEERAYDRAAFFAEYGDLSELEALGINTDSLTEKQLTDIAEVFAEYGDYSLLKALGVDTSGREAEELYNRLILKAKYNNM